MRDDRDYKLDLSTPQRDQRDGSPVGAPQRPFLSVQFVCCNVYARIYRNLDGARYEGRCPRCAKPITFVVGADGTDARSFVVE